MTGFHAITAGESVDNFVAELVTSSDPGAARFGRFLATGIPMRMKDFCNEELKRGASINDLINVMLSSFAGDLLTVIAPARLPPNTVDEIVGKVAVAFKKEVMQHYLEALAQLDIKR
jgi:hypothetical protein